MRKLLIKKIHRVNEILNEGGILTLLKRPFIKIKGLFYVRYLRSKINRLKKDYNLVSLFDFVYYTNEGLIQTKQIKSEFIELLAILRKHNPHLILEIGTANGGTLFLFSRIAARDAEIISIDLPGGMYGGGYSRLKIPLFKSFALPKQKIHLIRANSHHKTTLNEVKKILDKKKLDFLFIDGDHTYNGVKKDFEMYGPLVKYQGIIAFHDIVVHPPKTKININKFWNEIKDKFEYKEIVEDWNQNWAGIGILKQK